MEPGKQVKRRQLELSDGIQITLAGEALLPAKTIGQGMHSHPFWELLLMVSGESSILAQGTAHHFPKGGMILIPPLVEHKLESGRQPLEIRYLGFDFEPAILPAKVMNIGGRPEFHWLEDELPESISNTSEPSRLRLLALALRLLTQLATEDVKVSRNAILVKRAKSHIEDNLAKNICVRELAAMFYLTPHHFGELFHAETGATVKEWHRKRRMEMALQLLRDTERNVGEIAFELGYASIYSFSRDFKRSFGLSPTNCRIPQNSQSFPHSS